MTNTLITGRIYHVVDKTTGEVVKVGSTIQSLEQRFNGRDYQKKYTNHFLSEVRTIQSSECDWFQRRNSDCPFMWHLIAIEHLEVLKANTFKKGVYSNKQLPLIQKHHGFDSRFSFSGGEIAGRRNVENGHLERARQFITKERKIEGGKKAGKIAVESGRVHEMGRRGGSISGLKNGLLMCHNRWHVKREISNPNCKLCKAGI